MLDNLKCCPFCRSEARLQVTENGVAVVCTECGCRTNYYTDWSTFCGWDLWRKEETAVEKAIAAWNRRAKDAEIH